MILRIILSLYWFCQDTAKPPIPCVTKSSVPSADYTFSFYLSGHVRSSWCQNVTSHLSFSFNPIWLFWSALPLSHGNCSKAGGSDGRNPFESSRLRLRSWQQASTHKCSDCFHCSNTLAVPLCVIYFLVTVAFGSSDDGNGFIVCILIVEALRKVVFPWLERACAGKGRGWTIPNETKYQWTSSQLSWLVYLRPRI